MSDENRSKRWPLTGTLVVEFVDATDPDDATVAPNFGTFGTNCEPAAWHDDPRLPALLRWLADSIESDQRWTGTPKG